jgi:hypothetical protein
MRIDGPQITGSFSVGGTSITDLTSLATTGSNTFKGAQTFSGSLIPVGSGSFDLGSVNHPLN